MTFDALWRSVLGPPNDPNLSLLTLSALESAASVGFICLNCSKT